MQAAESLIRDTNMADQMVEYVKNQILVQAGSAMLAQANLKPQSVLQLLI
jgi:flagellin